MNKPHWNNSEDCKCKICRDSGYIFYEDENGYLFRRECDCGKVQKEKLQKKLAFAEIPDIFCDHEIGNFNIAVYESKEAQEIASMAKMICQNYVKKFPQMQQESKGLYLYSVTKGSGKTRMAASIANEIIKKYQVVVKFCTTLQILDEIRNTWNDKEQVILTEHQLIQDIIQVPVLVLDDIGVEKSTEWVEERFYYILDSRLKEGKVTIFTSNCKIELLKLDDRIKNRIMKMALPVPFPNESVRTNLAKKENQALLRQLLN